jgi:hypothetical protein
VEVKKKIDGSDYHIRERCATKNLLIVLCCGGTYIYRGQPTRNPNLSRLCRRGRLDRQGQRVRGNLKEEQALPRRTPNGPGQASHRRWSRTHIPIIQHISNTRHWFLVGNARKVGDQKDF